MCMNIMLTDEKRNKICLRASRKHVPPCVIVQDEDFARFERFVQDDVHPSFEVCMYRSYLGKHYVRITS